jgi:chromosome transmission fidelity protein 1
MTESRSVFDKILLDKEDPAGGRVGFVSIDADSRLAKIISQTHATLLIGGTMRPIGELAIVGKEARKKVDFFQGRHVVGRERIFARVLLDDDLCFTYANLQTHAEVMWTKVAQTVTRLAATMQRGGLVVFVSSYDMIDKLRAALCGRLSPDRHQMWFDKKGADVDKILAEFGASVKLRPSVLVSVVGGRLSEGIDFKDDLCRCVVLVGLPYPNVNDAVLREKMRYYDAKTSADCAISGQEFYESKCIKAVNQSVGRAIRHKNDWAGIVLIDSRFARTNIQNQLSEWLRDAGINCVSDVNQLCTDFADFAATMANARI